MIKERLNRRETYAASMVMFISLFYTLSLVGNFLQESGTGARPVLGITELKMAVLGVVYLTGSLLLFARKNAGWIISAATLLNIAAVAFMYLVAISQEGVFTMYALIPILFFVIILLCFFFLFGTGTRRKFAVTNKSYLLMIGAYLLLLALTYLM